jgi:hypothetical protein
VTVLDVSLSGVFTTTGTFDRTLRALPVARNRVDDTNVVGSAVPPKDTTDPGMKPIPFTVSVKLPTLIGEGLTVEIVGSGRMVTVALPLDVEDVVLTARTVTVEGLGCASGAA